MAENITSITPTPTVTPGSQQVAVSREPSAAELATEFVADPSFLPDDPEATAAAESTTQQRIVPADPKSIEQKEAEVKPIVPVEKKEPVTITAPKIDTKVEPIKVESKDGAAQEIKPIVPLGTKPEERDYSGFTAEEASLLKKMTNDAFNYCKVVFKEKKELSKLKDASYLQHPLAYTLSPEYSKLQEDAYYLNAESQYWQQQAVNIAEGKEWYELKGWNKDGSPALGAPQKPTSDAAENARKYSLHMFNKAQSVSEQVQQFSGRYKQQIASDESAIQQTCAQYFGWVKDPSLLEGKVSNPTIGEKTIKQVREDFISLFPPYHQNSTGIQVAAHLFAALQIYGQRIHELENGKQVAAVKEEEKALIEPTSKEQPAAQKNGHTTSPRGMWEAKEFSMEGIPV